MPVGNDAAGATDDRHEGGDVPRVHDGIETHVGPAARHEQVAVAISPSADEFCLGEQAVAGGAVLIFREIERVAGEQGGVSEPTGGATADGAVVERGGDAVADHELTEHGLVDHAEDGLAVMEECDQGAPQRDAGDEGFGAVDGIEDPNEFGVGAIAAEFFADDAVGGKFLAMRPRMSASAPRSASVTGEASLFVSTARSRRPKCGRMKAPLAWASSLLKAR